MRFTRTALNDVVDAMRRGDAHVIAKSENYRWEERVSAERLKAFEKGSDGVESSEDLDTHHGRYLTSTVNINSDKEDPISFTASNSNALVPVPSENRILLRIEDFSWCLADIIPMIFPIKKENVADFRSQAIAELKTSHEAESKLFDDFFHIYRTYSKERRPMFAAFEDELQRFPDWRKDWTTALPDLLGLAHLSATPENHRLVALMRYPVKRVLEEPGRAPKERRFAAPTVLDHSPNAWFLPSPLPNPQNPIHYGRAVHLRSQATMLCEIIHRRIIYDRNDVQDVAVLKTPITPSVETARMAHVEKLRRLNGCAAFAAD